MFIINSYLNNIDLTYLVIGATTFAVMSVQSVLFNAIHQNSLVYNTCWEDPRCDRMLLQLNQNSKVVMLTSAGCNALDYLIDGPAQVACIDMNYRQNALLELKKAFIRHCDYETFFACFGLCKLNRVELVYKTKVRPNLHSKIAAYWDTRIKFFNYTPFRRSFYYTGSSGLVALTVKRLFQTQPTLYKLIKQLFDADTLTQQTELYNQIEPQVFKPAMARLLNSAIAQSMIGVPLAQRELARQVYSDGMTGYMKHAFRKVFTTLPIADNYFYRLYLLGAYSMECCPEYLKQSNFNQLQQRLHIVKTHTSSLTEYLKQYPGKYTHFILLDHQDWMAHHEKAQLEEEWRFILKNAAPGARILMRSASHNRDFLPAFVHEYLTFDDDLVRTVEPFDRVGTYASTHLAYVNS